MRVLGTDRSMCDRADMLELISTKDAAEILGVTTSAMSRMVSRGALRPAMRLPGRFGAFMFLKDDIVNAAADHAGRKRPGPARLDVDAVA